METTNKLAALAAIDRAWLDAEEVSSVLNLHPQSLRSQAQDEPGKLGFSVIVCGSRVKIPKIPFLRFMGYDERKEQA